jgi:DNA invertase Pin-like site-specific DNA recombinase
MSVYGYARVSTDGQTLDAQIAQLKAAGAERVFREKVSGARADRPELARLARQGIVFSSPALTGSPGQPATC